MVQFTEKRWRQTQRSTIIKIKQFDDISPMLADTPKIEKPCDFIIKNDLKLPQDHSLRKKGITSNKHAVIASRCIGQ